MTWLFGVLTVKLFVVGVLAVKWRRERDRTVTAWHFERNQRWELIQQYVALQGYTVTLAERLGSIAQIYRRVPRRKWMATARRIARDVAVEGEAAYMMEHGE